MTSARFKELKSGISPRDIQEMSDYNKLLGGRRALRRFRWRESWRIVWSWLPPILALALRRREVGGRSWTAFLYGRRSLLRPFCGG